MSIHTRPWRLPLAALLLGLSGAALAHNPICECEEVQAGVTVLWIEHDLEAVGRLADRVSGLNRHLLFDGPAASSLTPERLLTLFSTQPRKNAEASR